MVKDGWVSESARRPAADQDDERQRCYRLKPSARRASRRPRQSGCGASRQRPARSQAAIPCLTSPRAPLKSTALFQSPRRTRRAPKRDPIDTRRRIGRFLWWLALVLSAGLPPRRGSRPVRALKSHARGGPPASWRSALRLAAIADTVAQRANRVDRVGPAVRPKSVRLEPTLG